MSTAGSSLTEKFLRNDLIVLYFAKKASFLTIRSEEETRVCMHEQ